MRVKHTLRILVVFMSVAAALIFAGVVKTELDYASAHPFAFGPAKVIAWCAGAGVLLALALALHAWSRGESD